MEPHDLHSIEVVGRHKGRINIHSVLVTDSTAPVEFIEYDVLERTLFGICTYTRQRGLFSH